MKLGLLGSFIGGIGLFLLGMKLMTDGLKLAAGKALKHLLGQWTQTPLRGLFSGLLITSLVQSSSAVTVAIIGFVNAGLLSLPRTISVIYGSNIGTTMTGWLVVLIGFQLNINAFALPLIGIGMLLSSTDVTGQRGAIGKALTGFGLFFLGIDILKGAFSSLGESLPLASLAGMDVSGVLIFVGIGFLLTFLMQSSSAAMAIILTAVIGGVIPFGNAAAAVIGANVGTTSTAALAVIGATPNAQRVAAAHVLFNLVTGLTAILLLPLLFSIAGSMGTLVNGLEPVMLLALFHTSFNVLGVLLFLPFTSQLVLFLKQKFVDEVENAGRPYYLDKNVVTTPSLALNAMSLEITRISVLARNMARASLSMEQMASQRMSIEKQALNNLVDSVGKFTIRMQSTDMPEEISSALPDALRVERYYSRVSELAIEIAENSRDLTRIEDETLVNAMGHFRAESSRLLDISDPSQPEFSLQQCEELLQSLQVDYQQLKSHLLRQGVEESIMVRQMVAHLDQYSNIRLMLIQAVKGAQYLSQLLALAVQYRQAQRSPD